jgi:predicted HAD superfamily Cof-like phosphohydrolase
MKTLMNDVADFHEACGVPILDKPQFPDWKRQALRLRLIEEEHTELKTAFALQDMPAVADAMADLIYVIVGSALELGIPLDKVWDAVQNANLTKIDPETGLVTKRADGKVTKPIGWQPPDIARILLDSGYEAA